MSDDEFEDYVGAYAAGRLSRRRFVRRLIAGGATFAGASALVTALGVSPAHAAPGGVYGSPPGLGGVLPPGLGGTPPGHGGTPPGKAKKLSF